MLIGAHVSPAGGPANAVARCVERGCRSIQIFNQNPRQWKPREYSDEEVEEYHSAFDDSDVDALLIHAVYLLNPASKEKEFRDKTLASLISSLHAGAALGAWALSLRSDVVSRNGTTLHRRNEKQRCRISQPTTAPRSITRNAAGAATARRLFSFPV